MYFRLFLCLTVISSSIMPLPVAHAASTASLLGLPAPGTMVNLTPAYEGVMVKGLRVHADNPLMFDFIVDTGSEHASGESLKKEADKLAKYFLASLTMPAKDLWVNLSPYEKDRIIPDALGQTEMGRDMLAQDYILKQLTASLIYPEKELGKEFWNRIYAKAQQIYGTSEIPVNTFNKVWIMADRAEVFERNQTAFVLDRHLKVMLEEDYLALSHGNVASPSARNDVSALHSVKVNEISSIGANIVRDIIIPELEKEVNTGKNFATLRQIFNTIILAGWYKNNLKDALLNQVYSDKAKVNGINLSDPAVKEKIYQQYLAAYKKGVFNYIKDSDPIKGRSDATSTPRKYFSGGVAVTEQVANPPVVHTAASARLSAAVAGPGSLAMVSFGASPAAAAMTALVTQVSEEAEAGRAYAAFKDNTAVVTSTVTVNGADGKSITYQSKMLQIGGSFYVFVEVVRDRSGYQSVSNQVLKLNGDKDFADRLFAKLGDHDTMQAFSVRANWGDNNEAVLAVFRQVAQSVSAAMTARELAIKETVESFLGARRIVARVIAISSHLMFLHQNSEGEVNLYPGAMLNPKLIAALVCRGFGLYKGDQDQLEADLRRAFQARNLDIPELPSGVLAEIPNPSDNAQVAKVEREGDTFILRDARGNSTRVDPNQAGLMPSLKIGSNEILVAGKGSPLMAFWTSRLPSVVEFMGRRIENLTDNPYVRQWVSTGTEKLVMALHGFSQPNPGKAGAAPNTPLAWENVITGVTNDKQESFISMSIDTAKSKYQGISNEVFGKNTKVTLTYRFRDGQLTTRWKVKNGGAVPIPWSGGTHPFMDLGNRNEWKVKVPAKKFWKLDPTTKLPLVQGPLDISVEELGHDFNGWVDLEGLKASIEIPFTDLDFTESINGKKYAVVEFFNKKTGELRRFLQDEKQANGMLWVPVGMPGLENTVSWQAIPAAPGALYLHAQNPQIKTGLVVINPNEDWTAESRMQVIKVPLIARDVTDIKNDIDEVITRRLGLDAKQNEFLQTPAEGIMIGKYKAVVYEQQESISLSALKGVITIKSRGGMRYSLKPDQFRQLVQDLYRDDATGITLLLKEMMKTPKQYSQIAKAVVQFTEAVAQYQHSKEDVGVGLLGSQLLSELENTRLIVGNDTLRQLLTPAEEDTGIGVYLSNSGAIERLTRELLAKDAAMIETTAPVVAPAANGGIDLDIDGKTVVRREGAGVEFKFDSAMAARIRQEGVQSLTPVIYSITPITTNSIWPMVGMTPSRREDELLAGV